MIVALPKLFLSWFGFNQAARSVSASQADSELLASGWTETKSLTVPLPVTSTANLPFPTQCSLSYTASLWSQYGNSLLFLTEKSNAFGLFSCPPNIFYRVPPDKRIRGHNLRGKISYTVGQRLKLLFRVGLKCEDANGVGRYAPGMSARSMQ